MDLIVTAAFTVTPVVAYALAFARRVRSWRIHRDRRARRELIATFALLLAGVTAAMSIAAVILGPTGEPWRRVLAGMAYGTFAAAGVVLAGETPREEGQ